MSLLFRYVLIGALALIPLFIVVQVVFWVNQLSVDLFQQISLYTNSTLYSSLIIAVTIFILGFIGFSTEKFGKSLVVSVIDKTLDKIPAIRIIYNIVKKITNLFMSKNKDDKKEVVLVEYPKKDLWVPAYVLSKHEDVLVLFVPTSPNPTSGYTVIVQRENIKETSLSVAEASQFIISMGADFIKKEEISAIIKNNKINTIKGNNMTTLRMEKQCGCFKKSSFSAEQTFNTKEEALEEAKNMCEDMNETFCQKHSFSFEENENEILIKMAQN